MSATAENDTKNEGKTNDPHAHVCQQVHTLKNADVQQYNTQKHPDKRDRQDQISV